MKKKFDWSKKVSVKGWDALYDHLGFWDLCDFGQAPWGWCDECHRSLRVQPDSTCVATYYQRSSPEEYEYVCYHCGEHSENIWPNDYERSGFVANRRYRINLKGQKS